ncbi:alkaline phosphatase PafA [Siphonobacter aquaeclarae]|uniref:Type I phosphodiesterase / nucleotide pyrophosphatase n=1 Tax=Siphonobacter aquaeclarae TaxID=563176 RepID=A0A1G9SJ16_9BACT|nr:alkaline phosphatase PafA [Siphonobacter aquaeclarae]SDM35498.1 Type I phosphodiesterase / nucleotide pyrophosphatase [Siphonobacter aquaeclarae]
MNRYKLSFLLLLSPLLLLAQAKPKTASGPAARPKLVVGIVVDQMRYDFLFRYAAKYGNGGFKRLLGEGYNCAYTHYNYMPTITAPGHTCVFTGSIPAIHGIVGNDWFDRSLGREVYCTEDTLAEAAGGSGSKAGKMSPRNVLATTITDQLKIATNFKSKVIGVSQKDRGAIIPAGHSADAAYWFDSRDGSWITSTFYMKDVPQWVKDFNAKKLANKYLEKPWTTLLPIEQYTESTADDMPWEVPIPGEKKPVFPHEVSGTFQGFYENFRKTPFGNTITKDFAIETLKNEKLGKGTETDFLTVSFSSTDYVGHSFGPNSIETEDTYLRLDQDIEALLSFLDTWVGKQNVLVFLSADHGVADVWGFSREHNIAAGSIQKVTNAASAALTAAYGEADWIQYFGNYQIYLNPEVLKAKNLTVSQVYPKVKEAVMKVPGVANVLNLQDFASLQINDNQAYFVKNGYHLKRGGDLMVVAEPGWQEGYVRAGTGHGTPNNYDSHVPCLFYGWKIPHGKTGASTHVTDIAATVAYLLDILEPSGCVGKPVEDLVSQVR